MWELLGLLLLIGIPILMLSGIILIFRWLLWRLTGYDTRREIEEAGRILHPRNTVFFIRRDLIDQSNDTRRKKSSKSANLHYDRIVDEEWAEAQAAQRLQIRNTIEDTPEEPVQLRQLLTPKKHNDQ